MRKALDADEDAGHRNRKALGAVVDGEVTIPQSASLTAPLTRGALGAAAPVQQYGGVMHGGKVGRACCRAQRI